MESEMQRALNLFNAAKHRYNDALQARKDANFIVIPLITQDGFDPVQTAIDAMQLCLENNLSKKDRKIAPEQADALFEVAAYLNHNSCGLRDAAWRIALDKDDGRRDCFNRKADEIDRQIKAIKDAIAYIWPWYGRGG